MSQPLQVTELDFGTLEFYEHYVVSTQNAEVHIGVEEHQKMMEVINTYFENSPFVYIANRKHSYSVDVMVYYEVIKVKNLLAIAVVNHLGSSVSTFSIETHFVDKPTKEFDSMDDAIEWSNSFL